MKPGWSRFSSCGITIIRFMIQKYRFSISDAALTCPAGSKSWLNWLLFFRARNSNFIWLIGTDQEWTLLLFYQIFQLLPKSKRSAIQYQSVLDVLLSWILHGALLQRGLAIIHPVTWPLFHSKGLSAPLGQTHEVRLLNKNRFLF